MLLLATMLATATIVSLAAQARPPREDPNSGAYLYRIHCTSCHGAGGRGDGPAARTLQVPPPDLTPMAERRGGIYPSDEIAQLIDGRRPLPGHTRQGMPRWGAVFGNLEMRNELAVKARIDALVSYLESLQRNRWR